MAVEDFKVYTQDSGWVSLAQTLPQGTSEGQLLHWDGTQWAAASDGTADGQYLVWNDTAKRWEPGTHETGNLPIQSDDGTVVLDSPSASTFTVSTGGKTRLTVRSDGNIGHGYAGQANINFATYCGFGVSSIEEIGMLSAPNFDSQPSVRCVSVESQPLFTDVTASNVYHFSAKDDRAGNKNFSGNHTGFYSTDLVLSTTRNCGFESAQNGANNFAFWGRGNSPSQFRGEVQTPTVKGLVDTDAQIALGSQAELKNGDGSEYVPNFPSSISTKKYVDEAVDDVIWVGTQAEYDALGIYDNKRLYCITD